MYSHRAIVHEHMAIMIGMLNLVPKLGRENKKHKKKTVSGAPRWVRSTGDLVHRAAPPGPGPGTAPLGAPAFEHSSRTPYT